MFKTKRLNDLPTVPYIVKYGPRSGQRSGEPTSVVDFSFLRPRELTKVSETWDNPELIEKLLELIEDWYLS